MEYTYYGRVKLKWKLTPERRVRSGWSYGSSWTITTLDPVEIQDDKWVDMFSYRYKPEGDIYFKIKNNPKIVEILRNVEVDVKDIHIYPPDRIFNKVERQRHSYDYQMTYKYEVVTVQEK